MIKIIFYSALFILTSCASFAPKEYPVEINLITVDVDNNPIDAVCSLYSSSNKIDVLSPKKIIFNTECSAVNVVCKAGDLYGSNGIINEEDTSAAESLFITSGIGYLFDRAVDAITPMGAMINLMSDNESHCEVKRKITVVLE
ncbi:MAG: hypothetical protein HOI56_05160 [Gammaproteobacteria bacterium]|jgi:hypothetical protein|nr:hypothetical protein [Gammaproteobacteria bacterium]MBT4462370.1 hypothetical protein [Gammaproteobacteria bacterium]MBT4655297.1 hypothetical protein [Gammaproteobacteria bacterium]MBT5117223.1 hypothetical protein [Gammaproteobacteria bacterium]MBT5762112.1 hypothetical protein [Gammaproteobacteria bacterium]|tara:strand:- start:90 stop:518 length:429 start_codon:yes stop_codon:yes gene_type:complete